MPAISVLIKPSSGMCDMDCEYCFYCDEANKRVQKTYGFMSEETLKQVIRKTMYRAEGVITYAFQGGEPTLRGLEFFEKVIEYQRRFNRNGIQIQNALQTNGYSIDETWCRFLKENHFLVGISVDGTRKTHDLYRHVSGKNLTKEEQRSFDRVSKSVELLEAYQIEVNILTVVHQRVAEEIKDIYQYYKKRGWNYQQYIACLDPLDEERGKSGFALTSDAYGTFLKELFDCWYADWRKGCQPYIRQFENYIGVLLGYRPEACDQVGKCGIQYVVEADGSVFPCDFYMLDDYYLGNFNQNRLEQLDKRREAIQFCSGGQQNKNCKACQYGYLCRGGCRRNKEWNEHTKQYENYFCESYKMFFSYAYKRLREIADVTARKMKDGNIR